MKTLRWRDRRQPARAERIGWLAWIAGLFAWLGQSGRYLVWVRAAILAVLAARYVLETATRARLARAEDEPLAAPTHVRDLDIRPASLPADIGAAARALWDGGQQRAALALLYRGLLSRLAHVHSVPIRDSTTEGDCLVLAAAHLATPRHDYVSRLVRLWQHAVYGHEDVSCRCGSRSVRRLRDGVGSAPPRLPRSERHRREQGPCLDCGSGGRVSARLLDREQHRVDRGEDPAAAQRGSGDESFLCRAALRGGARSADVVGSSARAAARQMQRSCVSAWHWSLTERRRYSLERWVESGGRLVVAGRLAGGEDEFERWSGITRTHRRARVQVRHVQCRALRLPSAHGGARRVTRGGRRRALHRVRRRSRDLPPDHAEDIVGPARRGGDAGRAGAGRPWLGHGNQRVAFLSSESAGRRPRPAVRRRRGPADGRRGALPFRGRPSVAPRAAVDIRQPGSRARSGRDRAWPVAEQCPIRPARERAADRAPFARRADPRHGPVRPPLWRRRVAARGEPPCAD